MEFDNEAQRTQTKEMNKYGHSTSFVYVLKTSLLSSILTYQSGVLKTALQIDFSCLAQGDFFLVE